MKKKNSTEKTVAKKGEEKVQAKNTTQNKRPDFKRPTWKKDIVFGVVNAILLVGLFYVLTLIPNKANEVSILRSLTFEGTANVQEFELESYQENIEKLEEVFVGEDEILDFVSEIEKLKEDGTVVNFSFQNEDPIKDKTKNNGLPIIISFNGNWANITRDIETIQSLPYLFRPVAFESSDQVVGGVEVEYGGILYVSDDYE